MRLGWFTTFRSSFYAILLHVIAAVLLVVSFDLTPDIVRRPHDDINIVDAVSVEKSAVDKELERLKKADTEKLEEEQKRITELEKKVAEEQQKTEEIRQKRLEEEEKLSLAKKQKEQEEKQRQEEQKKLQQIEEQKAELERQRKIEEEKRAQAELERKKQEELRKKEEEERQKAKAEKERLEKEKQEEQERLAKLEAERKEKERLAKLEAERKAAAEKAKQAAEKALQEQLAAEQTADEKRQQAASDKRIIGALGNEIHDSISRYFNLTGVPDNLECKLRVQLLPSGEVINASIIESSGNDIFDRRALTAVQKASPFPVPEDINTFERLNLRDLTINFKP